VRSIFRNCRLIGRRFRLAHVHFGREIIEVATFRSSAEDSEGDRHVENGMILRDNVYGSIAEDVLRRDFSVNALYYNIEDFSVVDYVGGLADLEQGCLRLIGDPEQRYREDPVRILRALRFACKLGFKIDPACDEPLHRIGHLLREVPSARIFDELLKLFLTGGALCAFEKLRHYGLFEHLFPLTDESLAYEDQAFPITFVSRGMSNTDERVSADKPVTPAFLYAVLLWEPVRRLAHELAGDALTMSEAVREAGDRVLAEQQARVSIPKRFSIPMREIWSLQPRFENRSGRKAERFSGHPRFRAGYDFLLLRAESGEVDPELAQWWTQYQEMTEEERARPARPAGRSRRRRRRKKAAGAPD